MKNLPPLLGEITNPTKNDVIHTTTILNTINKDPTMNPTLPQAVTQIVHHDSSTTSIGIKLNGANYGAWSQIVKMFVFGKISWDTCS